MDIDKNLYENAWKNAQIKYPSLRLRFEFNEDIIQIVDKQQNLDFRYIDLSTLSNEIEQDERIKQIEINDRNEKFQLYKGQLFRIHLIKQNDNLFTVLFSFHHIIIDGWSFSILFGSVHEDYLKLKDNISLKIDNDSAYEDTQIYLQMHSNDDSKYWQNEINKIYDRPNLSGLLKQEFKNKVILSEYDHIKEPKVKTIFITDELYCKIKLISKDNSITLSSILQFVWHKILSIYGGSSQTVVGTTSSGRFLPIDGIENSVGLYISTLPLLIEHNNNLSILESLEQVQNKINELISKSKINLSQIQKGQIKHGLFDSLFIYENYPDSKHNNDQICYQKVKSVEKIDYPISVFCYESTKNNEIILSIQYANEIINEEIIDDILSIIEHILKQITVDINKKMNEISFIPESQKTKLDLCNEKSTKNVSFENKNETLSQVFEEVASRNLNKTAIIYNEIKLTYKNLNEMANQLAHHLKTLISIKPKDIIALLLDKNELMIISILAVWKTGAAYVPIDPNFPNERVKFMLEDTNAKILIYNNEYDELSKAFSILKLNINDSYKQIFIDANAESKQNFKNDATCNSLAYVIYTSGTTGKPKAVLIEQRNVLSFKDALDECFGNDLKNDLKTVLWISSFVFDVSVEQILLSVFNANSLLIPILNTPITDNKSYTYFNQNKLSYISGTPTQITQLDLCKLQHVTTILLIGEPLIESTFMNIKKSINCTLINAYGPTETTVYNMLYRYKPSNFIFRDLIGKSLKNSKVYILNKYLQRVPIMAVGELYITGECIGRGYLKTPDLNNEKFLPNPFQTEQEKKEGRNSLMYKTGDLVRLLNDGNIEFIGRNDTQIKIRGFRVELGEIESVLSSYDGIERAVVLVKENKNLSSKYLIGYYVSSNTYEETSLQEYLETKLPNYMIPNRIIKIEKVPLTVNGKLNAKALPDVEINTERAEYENARNDVEAKLCKIWCGLLGVEDIGINDDFFRLGGDSIMLVKLVFLLKHEFNCVVSIKDVFVFKTIKKFYDNILSKCLVLYKPMKYNRTMSLVNADREFNNVSKLLFDLLPIQEWFFRKFKEPHIHYFNQSFLLKTQLLKESKLVESLNKLIRHHQAFRIRFKKISNKYAQYYCDLSNDERIILNRIDLKDFNREDHTLDELKLHNFLTNLQNKFDIENGPLFSVCYLTGFEDGSARIWFGIHHLIIDAVSWRIICEDLQRLYEGLELSDFSVKYSEWTNLIKNYNKLCSNAEESYWKSIVIDLVKFNKIIFNYGVNSYYVDKEIDFDKEQTALLLKQCTFLYDCQINALLLTALGFSLEILSKSETNYVTLEGHGREELEYDNEGNILDISRTVGWFTSMFPVRIKINRGRLRQSIKNVNRELLDIPNKGIGYGAIIGYEENDLPPIIFNYLGQLDTINKANNNNWHLTDGIVGDVISNEYNNMNSDYISINGHCYNGKMKFHVKSKYNEETTENFVNVFKMKIEQIINERNDAHFDGSNIENYSDDFLDPFVIFNSNMKKCLFILPPGEGGAESYFNNIVQYLNSYKLVIFNNYFLHLKSKNVDHLATLENLSSFYIKYIEQILPNGPFSFLGWSMGGNLAFEISRQLLISKQHVENLFILDSYFNIEKILNELNISQGEKIFNPLLFHYNPIISHDKLFSNTKTILFQATIPENDDDKFIHRNFLILNPKKLETIINRKIEVVMANTSHYGFLTSNSDLVQTINVIETCLN